MIPTIQLWEITASTRFDSGDRRIKWQIEFPAYTWGKEFDLKKLVSAELWIDQVFGKVDFLMEYRPDGDVCWHRWHEWCECTARNSAEDVCNPVAYPLDEYKDSFRSTITLPLPPNECQRVTNRPVNVGYQFQPRLTITGWCRIRGLLLHAEKVQRALYQNLVR